MKSIFLIVSLAVCSPAFGQDKHQVLFPPPVLGMEYPEFMDACQLPAHRNQLVYTRLIYSGIDEYWGLYTEKKCNNINADLCIPDSVVVKPEDVNNIKYVHDHYWNTKLIMDLIGTFDDSSQKGYGHLGSNNSRFVVKYVIDTYIAGKK
ncbi:MAG: hypothetical protein JST32_06805 [Bacteroidetes bacterium]|nr:hypothetical protein [Bacteroidota bacterium]